MFPPLLPGTQLFKAVLVVICFPSPKMNQKVGLSISSKPSEDLNTNASTRVNQQFCSLKSQVRKGSCPKSLNILMLSDRVSACNLWSPWPRAAESTEKQAEVESVLGMARVGRRRHQSCLSEGIHQHSMSSDGQQCLPCLCLSLQLFVRLEEEYYINNVAQNLACFLKFLFG